MYLGVFTIPGVPDAPERFPWLMHAHDPQHTGWFDFRPQTPDAIKEHPRQVERFNLIGSYPNPFNPSTTIKYALPEFAFVSLAIYNLQGHKVRTLLTESLPAGMHTVQWDGTSEDGEPVSAGMYFARWEASELAPTIKLVCLR